MRLVLFLALRELRSGLKGFRIFLACLAVGVGALAGAGATASILRRGLDLEARALLGGDLLVRVEGRGFTPAERRAVSAVGIAAFQRRADAMAQGGRGRELVEVRALDGPYPLAGRVRLAGAPDLAAAVGRDGGAGAAADAELLDRLGLRLGETLRLGGRPLVLEAAVTSEPDRASRGFATAPAVFVSPAAYGRLRLETGAALFGETARVDLPAAGDLAAAERRLRGRLGTDVRLTGREEAAVGLGRLLSVLEVFLSLMGLAALLAGGLGVSSAVGAYLERRTAPIGVLKALGATSGEVRSAYLLQILVLGAVGVAVGLAAGALAPLAAARVLSERLPEPVPLSLSPAPFLEAAAAGALSLLAFVLLPLARARRASPAALLRRELGARPTLGPELAGSILAGSALLALIVRAAPTPLAAAGLAAGLVGLLLLLTLAADGARRLSTVLRRPARGWLAVGLANVAGPRSAARTAAPALGVGVALLTAVLTLEGAVDHEVVRATPSRAPALVLTQIPFASGAAVDALAARDLGGPAPGAYRRFPFLTGRLTPARPVPGPAARILDRDLAMTAADLSVGADGAPQAGRYPPAGWTGEPEATLDVGLARAGGVRVGDEVVLSVLGRDLTVRVAAVRAVDFLRFGPSFPVVLNPHALDGARLRQVALARGSPAAIRRLSADLGRVLPDVLVIDVREQLGLALSLFRQIALAVGIAAGAALAAGGLTLIAALAASWTQRLQEAAVLRALGATRRVVLLAGAVEYGLVGLLAGVLGVAAGAGGAAAAVRGLLGVSLRLDAPRLALVLVLAVALAGAGGLAAALAALARPVGGALRDG